MTKGELNATKTHCSKKTKKRQKKIHPQSEDKESGQKNYKKFQEACRRKEI